MIYSLKGKIKNKGKNFVIIETSNIGWQVFVTNFFLEKIKIGQELEILTNLYLRKDTIELYGFKNSQELTYFKYLIAISSIGPKSALAILSLVKIQDLEEAILNKNTDLLTKVSGIGKKTAERIILELKNKIKNEREGSSSQDYLIIDALIKMGYSLHEARFALKKIPDNIKDVKIKIKEALKILS